MGAKHSSLICARPVKVIVPQNGAAKETKCGDFDISDRHEYSGVVDKYINSYIQKNTDVPSLADASYYELNESDSEDDMNNEDDEDGVSSLNEHGSQESLNYLLGRFGDNRNAEAQKKDSKPVAFLDPVSCIAEQSVPPPYSSDDNNINECIITAGCRGLNFSSTTFPLSGSITEGAIPEGLTWNLCITRHERQAYQPTIKDALLISDVYECQQHALKFKRPILIQFPCEAQAAMTSDSILIRRQVIYSDTDKNCVPNWVKVTADHPDISVVITKELINLFVSSFCLFGVVECKVPVQYIDMKVFGKFYKEEGVCKVTAVLVPQRTIYETVDSYGILITEKPFCLAQDCDKLTLKLEVDEPGHWDCTREYEELNTHYLWKGTHWTSTFVVEHKPAHACNMKTLFQGQLTAKNSDEAVTCLIVESLTQMMTQNDHLSAAQWNYQPAEFESSTGGHDTSSESMICKVIDDHESLQTNSSEYPVPKQHLVLKESQNKEDDLINAKTFGIKLHPSVGTIKLPHDIKEILARVLDKCNWKDLANELGYGQYCGQLYTGRTDHLLKLWEAKSDDTGTVKYLAQALTNIGHKELASLVLKY